MKNIRPHLIHLLSCLAAMFISSCGGIGGHQNPHVQDLMRYPEGTTLRYEGTISKFMGSESAHPRKLVYVVKITRRYPDHIEADGYMWVDGIKIHQNNGNGMYSSNEFPILYKLGLGPSSYQPKDPEALTSYVGYPAKNIGRSDWFITKSGNYTQKTGSLVFDNNIQVEQQTLTTKAGTFNCRLLTKRSNDKMLKLFSSDGQAPIMERVWYSDQAPGKLVAVETSDAWSLQYAGH